MNPATASQPDVMQVCRNGHVITDLLRTYPERGLGHCDRCGAPTLEGCPTCGHELPGAVPVPGLVPMGRSEPPLFCAHCGAAFPWAHRPNPAAPEPWPLLENLLRRLPRVARQLRVRQGDRPAFRVADGRDLEDLLRSLLPLHFDAVLPQCRTPSYAPGTITDFRLDPHEIVVTAKRGKADVSEQQWMEQLQEDVAHYSLELSPGTLVYFVYDPELTLHEPRKLEAAWSQAKDEMQVRGVIAS
jgi:hypothetical protein